MDLIIPEAQIEAIISEVKEELAKSLAKDAREDSPAEESSGSGAPADPMPPEELASGGSPAPEAPESPAEAPEAPAEAPPADEAAAAPEGSPEHEAGEIEPSPSPEVLQGEYAKLPTEDLKLHFLACKAAVMARIQEEGGGAGGPEAAPSPAPAPAGQPPMQMSERSPERSRSASASASASASPERSMSKSEKPLPLQKSEDALKLEALEKRAKEQDEELAKLVAAFEKVTTPVRKSIKGISDLRYIGKTEEEPKAEENLTKSEVRDRLKAKIRDGKLAKSDKELVQAYSLGHVDISQIRHLLAK